VLVWGWPQSCQKKKRMRGAGQWVAGTTFL
jgi:hypothetical protein